MYDNKKNNGFLSVNVNIKKILERENFYIFNVYSKSKLNEIQNYKLYINKKDIIYNKNTNSYKFKNSNHWFSIKSWIFIKNAKVKTSVIRNNIDIKLKDPQYILNNKYLQNIYKEEFKTYAIINNFNITEKGIVIYLNANNINVNLFIDKKSNLIEKINYNEFDKIENIKLKNIGDIKKKNVLYIKSNYFSYYKIRKFKFKSENKEIAEINIYCFNENIKIEIK